MIVLNIINTYIFLIKELKANVEELIAHDPYVKHIGYKEVQIVKDLDTALKGADCMEIATKHTEYYKLIWNMLKNS